MTTLLLIIHVTVSIALIIIVLLQAGKGAEAGASFGGGASQTMFGATGAKTFLSKMTTAAACVFMLTSLSLAYFYGKPGSDSLMPDQIKVEQSAPAQPAETAK
ncbi:MAG: preprotein translocase subunit SecG [Desulfuromonadaceae bacterium]|nr:preprotein translocase subunit SecG [Desulfuromonadaceae bacterium]